MLNIKWLRSRSHYVLALLPSLSFFKIMNIIICIISNLTKRRKSGRAPVVLAINITYKCNYACIMCQKSSVLKNVYTDSAKDMKFDELEKLLRENAKYISLVRLSGGEPLHYRDISKLIDVLDQLKMKYALLTNGSLLTPEISKKLILNCIEISISIDSADKQIYSKMRYPGNLDSVSENINFLNKLKSSNKSKTPILNVAATTFSFNISGVSDLIKFCHSHGIPTISVSEGGYYHTPEIQQKHLIKHHPKKIKSSIEKAKKIAKELKITLRLSSEILNSTDGKITSYDRKQITACTNFYIYASVDSHLDVFACGLSYSIGNLSGESLENIWNGKKYGFVKAREGMRNKKLPDSCKYCVDYNTRRLEDTQVYSYTMLQEELAKNVTTKPKLH